MPTELIVVLALYVALNFTTWCYLVNAIHRLQNRCDDQEADLRKLLPRTRFAEHYDPSYKSSARATPYNAQAHEDGD